MIMEKCLSMGVWKEPPKTEGAKTELKDLTDAGLHQSSVYLIDQDKHQNFSKTEDYSFSSIMIYLTF